MYSGTTLTPISGRIIGAHQKLDRMARRRLRLLLGPTADGLFPRIRPILHFEGENGPDGIKRKSPAHDEPWHYIRPHDENDTELADLIDHHVHGLTVALRDRNETRAAFEAAWLAHTIVDGLTPAHHFPYEETLAELRGGRDKSTRTTIRSKLVLPGDTAAKKVRNNWKMWGPKGLMSSHGFFEFGVATMLVTFPLRRVPVTAADVHALQGKTVSALFREIAQEIETLGMYDAYMRAGWTPRLAKRVRLHLMPAIVRLICLAWYACARDAGLLQPLAGSETDQKATTR